MHNFFLFLIIIKILAMKDDNEIRKIKSQKLAVALLLIGPTLIILNEFKKNDYSILGSLNFYVIIFSSIVLVICGSVGLKNSLRKEKKL